MSYQSVPGNAAGPLVSDSARAVDINDYDKNGKDYIVGNVFKHYDEDELSGPPLPATIYTSAMICSLGFSAQELVEWRSFWVILPNWLIVLFNYIFAFIVIICIKELRDDTPTCEADFGLLMLSVIAFTTYNLGEIYETFCMFYWIYYQPTSSKHEELTFNSDEEEILSGMTVEYKFLCYITLVFPKLLIGILIAYYGNTFLLCSDSNQDIILNSMALKFITENDEIIFESMVPQNLRDVTEKLPPIKVSHSTKLLGLYKPYLVAFFIGLITLWTYSDVCLDDPAKEIA